MAKFGYDQPSNYDLDSEGRVNICRFTCNETADYHQIAAYIECTTAAHKMRFAVYSNKVVSGKDYPDALLRQTEEITVPVGTGWRIAAFTSDIYLTSGTKYWLATHGSSAVGYLDSLYHFGVADQWTDCAQAYTSGFPNPFPANQLMSNLEMSIYCESETVVSARRMLGDSLTWIVTEQ